MDIMLLVVIFGLFAGANGLSPEEIANKHLQNVYQKKMLEKKQLDLLQEKYGDQELQIYKPDESSTYGVIRDAPEEQSPNFESRDIIYKPNPLEQAYQDAEYDRQNREYQYRQQREFVNQYIRNANSDGLDVNIDPDLNVKPAGPHRPQNRSRNPSGAAGN